MLNQTPDGSRLNRNNDCSLITTVMFIALSFCTSLSLVANAAPPFDSEACLRALTPGITPEVSAQTDAIVARDLPETEQLAMSIAQIARLNSSEFVMVGRSPTLLAAYFEAQRKMFHGLQTWVLPVSLKNERKLSASTLASRFTQLEDTFRESGRPQLPMVYIDAVSIGRTLIAIDRILASLGRKGLLIGFSDDVVSAKAQLEKAHVVNPFQIIPVSHAYMMHLSEHKTWAPYDSYAIEDEDVKLTHKPVANARFFDLRLKIEKHLELF